MPAYFESGFCVRTPAWHNLGLLLRSAPESWDSAWTLANNGSPWELGGADIHDAEGKPIPGWKSITRDDSGAVLHVARASYVPIRMSEYGGIIDAVRESFGDRLEYETTVVLHGGRRIATTLTAPKEVWGVKGDDSEILPYVNFMTSHDESVSWRAGASNVRIVCANTLAMAQDEMSRSGKSHVLRHTQNWTLRAPAVIEAIEAQIKGIDKVRAMARRLAGSMVTQSMVQEFLERYIPHSSDMTTRQMANVMHRRAQFMTILEGETNQSIAGTRWGLYQAALEQIDHYNPARSMETRADRTLFGGADSAKQRALELATWA